MSAHARSTSDNVVSTIRKDLRPAHQRLAGTPSLRPSDETIMDAYVEGDPAARAIIESWRFGGHAVVVRESLDSERAR